MTTTGGCVPFTYNVTITDGANGCGSVATHRVTVIEIRCGSGLDRIAMCNTSNKNQWVKKTDVQTRLNQGWKLGNCPSLTTAQLDGGNRGNPVIEDDNCTTCHPSGLLRLMKVKYPGTNGLTINARNHPQ